MAETITAFEQPALPRRPWLGRLPSGCQRFMEKQAEISARRLQAKVGTRQTVIVDEVTPEGAVARTKGDAPEIDGNVFIDGAIHLEPGMLVDVEIEEADAYDLWGHLVH